MRRKKKQPKRLPKQSENPKKMAPKGSETVPESRKTAQEEGPKKEGPMMRAPRRRPKEAPKRAKPMRPGVGRYTRAQEQRWENAIS